MIHQWKMLQRKHQQTCGRILWYAHDNLPPRNLKKSYVSSKSIDTQRKRIDEIIEKSRKLEKKECI